MSGVGQPLPPHPLNSGANLTPNGNPPRRRGRARKGPKYSAFGGIAPFTDGATPPSPLILLPTHADCPCPPNWTQSLEQARLLVTSPFMKIPVAEESAEWLALLRYFQSDSTAATITHVERVVNPELWRRFTRTRTELLISKSDDFNLLAELGLSEKEVAERTHVSMNFDRSRLQGSPYADNMVLLFHGSKGRDAVDTILSQGLDDRLGNTWGLLGRGIYFTDDSAKAMQYDKNGMLIVCAVILGDCLAGGEGGAVREPEKQPGQKRNPQDLFFDSVVGRPGPHNEYVIYNRSQCCPLYTISYTRNSAMSDQSVHIQLDYLRAQAQLPSFAWTKAISLSTDEQLGQVLYPFHARTIFQVMHAPHQLQPFQGDEGSTAAPLAPSPSSNSSPSNIETYNFLFDDIVDFTQERKKPDTPAASTVPTPGYEWLDSLLMELGGSPPPAALEECPICFSEYTPSGSDWEVLDCTHKICTSCTAQMRGTGSTMSGQVHTWLKCPFCQSCSGVQVGDCPDGTMKVRNLSRPAAGYEGWGSISIRYLVQNGVHFLNRTAYLPATPEGFRILNLLKTAWDRRLCFRIGTSLTTGATNVLVWNLHHKSALRGGLYGYPDPGYLLRVGQELAQYGIR